MFFQLSQIRKQQEWVQNMESIKQKTHDALVGSYSFGQGVGKSLKEKFNSVLNKSALLLHILHQIEESIRHKNLMPSIFNDNELNKLIYNRDSLPQWFEHVFSKEYQKQKINFQTLASKIYKLHGLGEERAQLEKQQRNVQTIFNRYESLDAQQLQNINIIEEMESFESSYKGCKQMYRNFLFLMAKKVLEFLEKTVESTLVYSSQLKKVSSSQNVSYPSTKNQTQRIQLQNKPQFYRLSFTNRDEVNKTKIKSPRNIQENQMISDYFVQSIDQTKANIKNNSTAESLRQKQKENNEFFFRKAKNRDKYNQTFLSKQVNSPRSQNNERLYSPKVRNQYPKRLQTSRDSSNQTERNYYQDSLAFKKYQPIRKSKPQEPITTYHNYRSLSKDIEIKDKIKSHQHECYHHCPHHDKLLNSHCSKHCQNMCKHQKQYFNDFRLDLTQMDRQYYQSRSKVKEQSLKTYRSANNIQAYPKLESPRYKEPRYENKVRHNVNTDYDYLRSSHGKYMSPQNYEGSNYNYRSHNSPLNVKVSGLQTNVSTKSRQFYPNQRNNPLSLNQKYPSPTRFSQYYN